jgi:threonine/homoserine/homoserine lactone efflux protein
VSRPVQSSVVPTVETLGAFVVATLVLIAIPGPSTFYLVSRGVSSGRRAAFVSALGIETGTVLLVCLTAFGLSALIASTAYAFTALHYLGAAYLLFLGWRALRARTEMTAPNAERTGSFLKAYRQGFVVGASNPKVALFFLAFFPQFVRPDRGSATTQVLVLGVVFVCLGLAADTLNSYASGAIGGWLARCPRFLRMRSRVEAASYVGLGTWALVSGSPSRTR